MLPETHINKNKTSGIRINLAYFKFSLKLTALTKGIGFMCCERCSIAANNKSESLLLSANSNKFKSLSSTSGKCFPISNEASLLEIPFLILNK